MTVDIKNIGNLRASRKMKCVLKHT